MGSLNITAADNNPRPPAIFKNPILNVPVAALIARFKPINPPTVTKIWFFISFNFSVLPSESACKVSIPLNAKKAPNRRVKILFKLNKEPLALFPKTIAGFSVAAVILFSITLSLPSLNFCWASFVSNICSCLSFCLSKA